MGNFFLSRTSGFCFFNFGGRPFFFFRSSALRRFTRAPWFVPGGSELFRWLFGGLHHSVLGQGGLRGTPDLIWLSPSVDLLDFARSVPYQIFFFLFSLEFA